MKRVLVLVVCVFALLGATTAAIAQQVRVLAGQTAAMLTTASRCRRCGTATW